MWWGGWRAGVCVGGVGWGGGHVRANMFCQKYPCPGGHTFYFFFFSL